MARRRRLDLSPNQHLLNVLTRALTPSPGSLLTESQARAAGSVGATATSGITALHRVQRARLLSEGIKSGKINPQTLSPSDQGLVQQSVLSGVVKPPQPHTGGGIFSTIGHFFSNLGSDVWHAATELPQGIATTATSAAHDIGQALQHSGGNPFAAIPEILSDPFRGGSATHHNVVAPLVASEKYTWGPLFHGHVGQFLNRFQQHPLNPLLDVASVASGGLGAAARAARSVAPESRLASIISREGRAPVRLSSGISDRAATERGINIPEIPRDYSTQPLRHIAQVGMDRLVKGGLGAKRIFPTQTRGRISLQDVSQLRAISRFADRAHANEVLESTRRAHLATQGFIHSLNDLTPDETVALHFALRGINDRGLIGLAQDYFKNGLQGLNEPGHNFGDFNAPENYTRYLADLPEKVVEHIDHPTPAMVRASNLWHTAIEEGRQELGIPDEIHAANMVRTNRMLNGHTEELAPDEIQRIIGGDMHGFVPHPDYPIKPTYVPDVEARGMQFGHEHAGPIAAAARAVGLSRKGEKLEPGERHIYINPISPESLIRSPYQAYLKPSDLGTFHSGTFRTDARVLSDHINKREQDLVSEIFNARRLNTVALKDADGELLRFKNQRDLDKMTGTNRGYVFLPVDGAYRWFRQESNSLQQVVKVLQDADEHGLDFHNPQLTNQLERLLDDNAKKTAFEISSFGARKNEGIAVPAQFYRRMEQIAKSQEPLPTIAGQMYTKFINFWRARTLAWMPRWWINTAVGTAFLNMVKGVWNPRDYILAKKLMNSERLPAGVDLGSFAAHEALEGPSGLLHAAGPTRIGYQIPERIESYFRTASFVQSLRSEARREMRNIGDVLKSYTPFMRNEAMSIDQLLKQPKLVDHALDDVNRFAYSMHELGPIERRYVRAFVPFWGWYKFITKLVWRLPIDYPGRALVITKLGEIGQHATDDLGVMPPWLQGAIFLNHDKKHLLALPTRGLNPFSQFANPFSPEGTVAGLVQWGQLSPVIQAAVSGAGVNTLTGGPSEISPQSGVGFDFWGNPFDLKTGKPLENVGQRMSARRGIMTLLRSFPQVRIAEPFFSGGNPVYPESVPIISPRPMAVRPESRHEYGLGTFAQFLGTEPKSVNLAKTQELMAKQLQYARKTNQRQKAQLKSRLRK